MSLDRVLRLTVHWDNNNARLLGISCAPAPRAGYLVVFAPSLRATPLPALLLLAVFSCLVSTQLFAQGETTSAITGQVTAASGSAISGATVTIVSTENGLRRSVVTDDAGRFRFPQLRPGTYTVKVEAQGFAPQQIDSVASGLGQNQTANFALSVAAAKQSVMVTGSFLQEPLLVVPEHFGVSARNTRLSIQCGRLSGGGSAPQRQRLRQPAQRVPLQWRS